MPYHNALAIANIYVNRGLDTGYGLTTPCLSKLAFFSHAWNLGYNGEPLVTQNVISDYFGPRIREVDLAFINNGLFAGIPARDENGEEYSCALSEEELEIVDRVYDFYTDMTSDERFSAITELGGFWPRYRRRRRAVIPNEEIKEYFQLHASKNEERQPVII